MDGSDNKEKQSIKSKRVRAYFVQAAKDIILSEGVENISVRKVADLAGYSYATLYNYFTVLNALLLEVKAAMIGDLVEYMNERLSEKLYELDDIKKINRLYLSYLLDRPHVFRFFYSYRLPNEMKTDVAQGIEFSSNWQGTYKGVVMSGAIQEADVEIISKTVVYAMHGMLALYFSDAGLPKEILYQDLDDLTEYLLK